MKNSLLKPFTYFQEKQLLVFGLGISLLFCLVQLTTHSRTISILQIANIDQAPPTLLQVLADLAISSGIMTLALYIFGRIINPKTRCIDIFNTVTLARIPLFLCILFDVNGYLSSKQKILLQYINDPEALASQTALLIPLAITGILTILLLVGFGYYIYQGFKTATHMKKPLHIIVFIVLILSVDLLTRLLTTAY